MSLAHRHRAVLAGALFPVAAAGRDGRRRDHGGRGHGAGAVAPGDALSVLARRAPRSGRSAALRVSAADGATTGSRRSSVLHAGRAALSPGRRATLEILKGAELAVWPGQSVALVGAVGRRQVDAAAHRRPARARPTAARSIVDGAPTVEPVATPSARASAAPRSASSISSTICCRSSRRSRT